MGEPYQIRHSGCSDTASKGRSLLSVARKPNIFFPRGFRLLCAEQETGVAPKAIGLGDHAPEAPRRPALVWLPRAHTRTPTIWKAHLGDDTYRYHLEGT
jgi:hypothetical protein